MTVDEAVERIERDAREGRLDPDAVVAVADAAGRSLKTAILRPAGLSEREIEVLNLIARGLSNRWSTSTR